MPSNAGYTLSIECILREAKFRWLKGYEVLCILQNYQQYGLQLSPAAPVDPQSGSLFLFNKRLVKFRKDGINWRKQKDGKTVRESHEKLKVGGVKVLSCCYTRAEENPAFQRRIYWLLDGDATTVLVHYLTLEKDAGKDDCSLFETSIDEVETPGSQYALRSSLYFRNDNNDDEKEDCSTGPEDASDEDTSESQIDANYALNNFHINNESLVAFVNSLIVNPETNTTAPVQSMPPTVSPHTISLQPSPTSDCIGSTPDISTCVSPCLGRLATISDFSPEWDYVDGGGKILIMGPDFHSGLNYHVMFDQTEVPAELVQDGVLRCRTPPHFKPGFVSFCVTRGNFVLFSEVCHFEYRTKDMSNDSMNMNERNFKLRIIEQLERLEREINALDSITLSESIMENLSHTLEDKYLSEEQLEDVFVKILANLMERIDNSDLLNTQDRDGMTLLHYACALKYRNLAATLVACGANPNVQDRNGNSPFQWAMKNRDQPMIKTLVDYVDLNKNQTSFDYSPKSQELDSCFTPQPITPSLDGMISGIDELGIDSSSETASPSPVIRRKFVGRDSPRSVPSSPMTPHSRMRRAALRNSRGDEDVEIASPSQSAFQQYRARRVEHIEDETKKRVARARDSVLSGKRK
jgi:hypothetical protein